MKLSRLPTSASPLVVEPGAVVASDQESELASIERRVTHDTIAPSLPSYEAPDHWSVSVEAQLSQQGAMHVAL